MQHEARPFRARSMAPARVASASKVGGGSPFTKRQAYQASQAVLRPQVAALHGRLCPDRSQGDFTAALQGTDELQDCLQICLAAKECDPKPSQALIFLRANAFLLKSAFQLNANVSAPSTLQHSSLLPAELERSLPNHAEA